MLRHIARVLWFRENKACVGLSSGSRTNACMPDDWESLPTCTVEPGNMWLQVQINMPAMCLLYKVLCISGLSMLFQKVLNERLICAGWASHQYWMSSPLVLDEKYRQYHSRGYSPYWQGQGMKTAAGKRGIEHYCRRDSMPYSSKIYRVMM